jgi:phosphoserine phosphatase
MSMCELSYKTGISEKDLARYESLGDPILYTNTYGFAKATYGNILKLEKILQCQGEIVGDADINQERKCLFEKKEKNPPIIPVTDAEAVVFDFDGTLTTNEYGRSSWQDLWTLLGDPENLCSQYHKLYKTHIITHAQWCKMTQQYFSEHNLTEAMVVEYAKGKSLIKDFEEAIKILNEEKIKIYICSGSINTIIQTVVGKNMQYIEDCKYNTFEYHNGVLSEIKGTQYDFEGKRDFVKRVKADNDIDPDKVVFVGNPLQLAP